MRFLLLSAIFVITAFLAISFTASPKQAEILPETDTAPLSVTEMSEEKQEIPAPPAIADVLNSNIETGETLIIEFSEAPNRVLLNEETITPFPYQESFRAVVPLGLGTKTGTYTIKVNFENSTTIQKTIFLAEKEQKIIILPPPPKLGLSDKEITQSLLTSNTDLRKVVSDIEEITRFAEPFDLPVDEGFLISSPFGEVRKTGEESITHLGTDFDVPKGTPVRAINRGLVKNAYLDSIYGNSVIVDHGRGIYSLYLHLESINVKTGDIINKGQVVGFAGDSGLSSAPHLHLSLKINGISIDPIQFINTFK